MIVVFSIQSNNANYNLVTFFEVETRAVTLFRTV